MFSDALKTRFATTSMESQFEKVRQKKICRIAGRIYCLFTYLVISSVLVGWNEHFQ